MLDLRVLGDLRIRVDGQHARLSSRKAQALLVYLAVEREQQPRSLLASMLWPESDQQHADTSLRVALTTLNKICGSYLTQTRTRVGIDWDQVVNVDLNALLVAADQGDDDRALDLYKGPFLSGFYLPDSESFETWRTWQNERLLKIIAQCFHKSIENALNEASDHDPMTLALQLLKLDPMDELAHRAIMLVHARRGNRSAALEQFDQCRAQMRRELDIEPSSQTRLLFEQIQSGDVQQLEDQVPVTRVVVPQKMPLIDRQGELAELLTRIASEECRLLTVLGPGGIGKSRLAVEALREAADLFRDGVFFCPLASIASSEFVLPAISRTLNFYVDSLVTIQDPKSQLIDFLSTRRIFLVLDGFEHLLDSSRLLAELLENAPGLKLLLTSRERLRLRQEWVLQLEGLPLKAQGHPVSGSIPPALELFMKRTEQVRGSQAFAAEEHTAAEEICSLVEGNPLAIELAASWTDALSTPEILVQIRSDLDFLTSRLKNQPDEHRSLRVVFERSWSLLPERLRSTLAALSVFRGTFQREAAEAVTGAGFKDLAALGDKSLIRRSALGHYSLHASIQYFSSEKLGQKPTLAEKVRSAHARYYLGLLNELGPQMITTQMPEAREIVIKELANIWVALDWAVTDLNDEKLHQLLDNLFSFYVAHDWHDGVVALGRLARMIQQVGASQMQADPFAHTLFRSASARQAWFLSHLGKSKESQSLSERCMRWVTEDNSPEIRSICLNNMGINACLQGRFEHGVNYLEQAIALGHGYAEPVFPSYHLWLGYVRFLQGLYSESMVDYQTCYDLFEKQGNQPGMAFALSKMGLSADGMRSYEQGLDYHRRALEIFRATNHISGQAYTYSRMSVDAYGLGDYCQAAEWAEEGLRRFSALGHRWGISNSRCRLAFAEIGMGLLEQAKGHLLDALSRAHEHQMTPLMLYSILGLACVLLREDEIEWALELHRVVATTPQTPVIYLDLAARWFDEVHQTGKTAAPANLPAFEVTQTSLPRSELDALARQLLEQGLATER